VDIISKRAEANYNYGVILIPEGLIDFITEVPITLLNNIHSLWTLNYVLLILSLYNQFESLFIYSFIHAIVYLQVQHLIAELNEILAHDTVDEGGLWKKKLNDQSLELFEFLPQAIQEQLLLERDPHGNVQVSKVA
jgi:pyrophosphate--fructose-6-phosphate 1-phosphotransferase